MNAVPTWKEGEKRQGGKSEKLQMFEQVVYAHLQNPQRQLTAAQWLKAVEGNRFGGSIMKDHESKRGKWSHSLVKRSGCRCTEVISFRFLGSCKELRWAEPCKSSLPPAFKDSWLRIIYNEFTMCEALETGFDTHTTPIPAVKRFSSHLTSLRKKGKEKTERENAKGKRER